MPIPQLFDLVMITLASYFIMRHLHRKEVSSKVEDDSLCVKYMSERIRLYFSLTLFVCVAALGALDLFVPYGNLAILVLAACGLCSVIMDTMLLIVACWKKTVFPPEQPQSRCCPAETQNKPQLPPSEKREAANPDPYKRFY